MLLPYPVGRQTRVSFFPSTTWTIVSSWCCFRLKFRLYLCFTASINVDNDILETQIIQKMVKILNYRMNTKKLHNRKHLGSPRTLRWRNNLAESCWRVKKTASSLKIWFGVTGRACVTPNLKTWRPRKANVHWSWKNSRKHSFQHIRWTSLYAVISH